MAPVHGTRAKYNGKSGRVTSELEGFPMNRPSMTPQTRRHYLPCVNFCRWPIHSIISLSCCIDASGRIVVVFHEMGSLESSIHS